MSSPKQASSPKSPSSPAKGLRLARTTLLRQPSGQTMAQLKWYAALHFCLQPILLTQVGRRCRLYVLRVPSVDPYMNCSTRVTDTESLRTSILNYKWENGRRYHAYNDGAYWLWYGNLGHVSYPSDQAAVQLSHSPFSEFADEHPSADVLGVDLSPIQPGFVPPNCKFEVDDINQEWTFPDNSFDFVHIRAMTGCIPDWVELHKKAFKALKPGGWVEHVELWGITKSDDGSLKDNSPLKKWVQVFEKIGALTGKGFFYGHKAANFQREAGFENLVERRLKMPLGPWPKDKRLKTWGAWNRQFLLQALEGFSIRGLTELLGWTYDDAQLFLVEMRNELLNPAVHSYGEVYVNPPSPLDI
ncbi:hypothetical protein LRP88_14876 [Fusarium phalaenopsidis]